MRTELASLKGPQTVDAWDLHLRTLIDMVLHDGEVRGELGSAELALAAVDFMFVDLLIGKGPLARDALNACFDEQALENSVYLYELRRLSLAAWALGTIGCDGVRDTARRCAPRGCRRRRRPQRAPASARGSGLR